MLRPDYFAVQRNGFADSSFSPAGRLLAAAGISIVLGIWITTAFHGLPSSAARAAQGRVTATQAESVEVVSGTTRAPLGRLVARELQAGKPTARSE